MELAISIIVLLLAYRFFREGISRKSTVAQKLSGNGDGPNDKAGLSPAIALVLRRLP